MPADDVIAPHVLLSTVCLTDWLRLRHMPEYWVPNSDDHVWILELCISFYLADSVAASLTSFDAVILAHHALTAATYELARASGTAGRWAVLLSLVCLPPDIILNIYKVSVDAGYTRAAHVLRVANKWALLLSRAVFGLAFAVYFIAVSYFGDDWPQPICTAAFIAFLGIEVMGTVWAIQAFGPRQTGKKHS